MAKKDTSPNGFNILNRAWNELKRINWHEINRLCQQNFNIGIIGSEREVEMIQNWLISFPRQTNQDQSPISVKCNIRLLAKYLTPIYIMDTGKKLDEKLIKSMTFCIVSPNYASQVRRFKTEVYIFDHLENEHLPTQILAAHNDLRFALAYHFPVFRREHATIVIQDTAFQNTAWTVISSVPNTVPGPHQIVAIPFEGISDFIILSINEMKMLFELIGLSGYSVVPYRQLPAIGILLAMALLAQNTATSILGKLPARAGTVVKGALAYAFTYAIGEAIFAYLSYRQNINGCFFRDKIRKHYAEGIKIVNDIVNQKEENSHGYS
jgi:hypothetical protein